MSYTLFDFREFTDCCVYVLEIMHDERCIDYNFVDGKFKEEKFLALNIKKPTNTTWFFNIFNPFVFQLLLILFLKASKVEISPFISIIASVYSSQLKSECKKKIDKFSSATRSVLFSHFFILRKMHVKWTVGLLFIEMQSFVIFSCLSLARCHPR